MLSKVWIVLMLLGMLVALLSGKADAILPAMFEGGKKGISFCLELAGILAIWTGLLKIAEKSGLVNFIVKIIGPVIGKLFPAVPKSHPAFSQILLNMSANILGLGNVATPSGIKAMQEMQKLNRSREVASDSMIRLLVFNTSIIQLIPGTVLALRSEAGSKTPSDILIPLWISGILSFLVSMIVLWLIERRKSY